VPSAIVCLALIISQSSSPSGVPALFSLHDRIETLANSLPSLFCGSAGLPPASRPNRDTCRDHASLSLGACRPPSSSRPKRDVCLPAFSPQVSPAVSLTYWTNWDQRLILLVLGLPLPNVSTRSVLFFWDKNTVVLFIRCRVTSCSLTTPLIKDFAEVLVLCVPVQGGSRDWAVLCPNFQVLYPSRIRHPFYWIPPLPEE
jgi:hypothetical protein